jgi:hypothetical protein
MKSLKDLIAFEVKWEGKYIELDAHLESEVRLFTGNYTEKKREL